MTCVTMHKLPTRIKHPVEVRREITKKIITPARTGAFDLKFAHGHGFGLYWFSVRVHWSKSVFLKDGACLRPQ
jgi:hypothetical protein